VTQSLGINSRAVGAGRTLFWSQSLLVIFQFPFRHPGDRFDRAGDRFDMGRRPKSATPEDNYCRSLTLRSCSGHEYGSALARPVTVSDSRNDFIHAWFAPDYVEAGYVEPGYQTTSATRIKSGLVRPVGDLTEARERAAGLSCLMAHINYCIKKLSGCHGQSLWLERVEAFLRASQASGP
jgi:hypothetical protein